MSKIHRQFPRNNRSHEHRSHEGQRSGSKRKRRVQLENAVARARDAHAAGVTVTQLVQRRALECEAIRAEARRQFTSRHTPSPHRFDSFGYRGW